MGKFFKRADYDPTSNKAGANPKSEYLHNKNIPTGEAMDRLVKEWLNRKVPGVRKEYPAVMTKEARISKIVEWLGKKTMKPQTRRKLLTKKPVKKVIREAKSLDQTADLVAPRLNKVTKKVIDVPAPTFGVAEGLAAANYGLALPTHIVMKSPKLTNLNQKVQTAITKYLTPYLG
tara:strand:+ start:4709 stop:5233 length:525 start_codon:yes stop_codon:yes gene_type:complete